MEKDWKLKLKYGKLKTPYQHFTVLGNGIVGQLSAGFEHPPGPAWMGIKVWAESTDQAIEMIQSIGNQIGFEVKGRINVFETDPIEPPSENPYGYGITFSSYEE